MSLPPKNRVFVTSAGIVCALGYDLPSFFSGLRGETSALKILSRIDTTGLATRVAGEVAFDRLVPPPPLSSRAKRSWDPILDPKAFLAWTALKQLPLSPGEVDVMLHPPNRKHGSETKNGLMPMFCSVGLECVDISALSSALPEMPICPEYPPTLLPGMLAVALGTLGPTFVQASACAAGTIALGTAFRSIRAGLFPAAVAGGVDSMLSPYGIHAFNSLSALSERDDLGAAALAPFDRKRSGTLLGEGAAFLLLESEASLLVSGRVPLAEIVGFGGSTDAFHPVMPCPDGRGAVEAMQHALADAGLTPDQVDYINAHGTGTLQNDRAEALAIMTLFGERGRQVPVSSSKPYFGHLLSAAGAVETVGCLLPLTADILPPTLHFTTPDPECPVDCIPNKCRSARPNIVMKNSYGFGGQNASLILKKVV
jgi:3-oxoacyl-[acyl-carrier-protein] synthase II